VMGRLRPPTWPPTNPYSGVVSDYVHSEADFRDLQVLPLTSNKSGAICELRGVHGVRGTEKRRHSVS
jgi:hypothetical protein